MSNASTTDVGSTLKFTPSSADLDATESPVARIVARFR